MNRTSKWGRVLAALLLPQSWDSLVCSGKLCSGQHELAMLECE